VKLGIVGASNFVNRMFEACGPYQWAREFLKNSLEAGASRVEFGIEWQAVEKLGVYRRTIIDDASGMSRDELLRFFSTLGEGAGKIGGIHDNFGVGAKIASLPWNPKGVVVISYKNGQASMIWIELDPESRDYELVEFEAAGTTSCVIDPTQVAWPGADWGTIRPDWLTEHGTIVVLLGSEEYPDTVLGNPVAGEKDIKGLSVYLNTRFWHLSSVEVRVVELRSEKKNSWPTGANDKDDARRPNNRQIMGAKHYLTEVKATAGKLVATDVLLIDRERVMAEWYLWEGERPAIHSYAKRPGYVALRYNGELFHLTSHKVHFRWFGIIESQVQQNLTIILEPQHYKIDNGRWGIHPDQSRNRLIFTGNGEKGAEVPMSDWGLEFAENMPAAILEAIRKARGDLSASIEDEEYRKRLQDKFGDRWKTKALVQARKKGQKTDTGEVTDEDVEVIEDPTPVKPTSRHKRKKTLKVVLKRAIPGGPDAVVEAEVPVDVPLIRFGHKDEFDRPWHIALWAPNDPDGPTVVVNIDSQVVEEAVKYHQELYPDVYAEEVAKIVRQVYGEVAACKIAHSQKLTKEVPVEELDRDYRSEAALTTALMGLLAEESLIAQRLGKLGKKKTAA